MEPRSLDGSSGGLDGSSGGTGGGLDGSSGGLDGSSGGLEGVKVVFVTEATTRGKIQIAGGASGRAAADTLCANEAKAAQVLRPVVAWLSDPSSPTPNAIDRLVEDGRPWATRTGKKVFANRAAIAASTFPVHAIQETAKGASIPANADVISVWTGTEAGGRLATVAGTCNGWSSLLDSFGAIGDSTAASNNWTYAATVDCGTEGRIYCFEP